MARKVSITIDKSGADGFFRRARDHARALDKGESIRAETVIAFEDPADMVRMLTTERIRLLSFLREEGAAPLTDLANRLGRNKRAVSRDVSALSEHGLLITRQVANPGHGRRLIVSPAARILKLRAAI